MEFQKKWINWVLETADVESVSNIGHRCYQDSQWVREIPRYTGEKRIESIIAYLESTLPSFIFKPAKGGFTVDLNENKCFCPLVQSGITKNPKLCHCTKTFDKAMYEKLLNTQVEVKILKTILSGDKSCVFEVILKK